VEHRLRAFENSVFRRIFGPKHGKIAGKWRRLHNVELLAQYYSDDQVEKNEVDMTCSMWRHVYKVKVEIPEERYHLEDPGIDGRIILMWIYRKWGGGAWTGLIWIRIGTGGGLL
jgi:hypothetical protein